MIRFLTSLKPKRNIVSKSLFTIDKKQKLFYIYRDENAALNILKEGQRIFNSTVGNTESLGKYPSKPIDTGLVTVLESELLKNPSIEGPLL